MARVGQKKQNTDMIPIFVISGMSQPTFGGTIDFEDYLEI